MLPALPLVLGLVAGLRIGELFIARRNTKALLARGAFEVGAAHYPLFILLHASWLIAMALLIPMYAYPNMILLAVFLVLQLGRLWVISTLGPYWTTRIITLPGAPLVKRGPFRLVRHPNYLVVACEIAVLPLAFGAWRIAVVFSILSAMLTLYRIRLEDAALAARA